MPGKSASQGCTDIFKINRNKARTSCKFQRKSHKRRSAQKDPRTAIIVSKKFLCVLCGFVGAYRVFFSLCSTISRKALVSDSDGILFVFELPLVSRFNCCFS